MPNNVPPFSCFKSVCEGCSTHKGVSLQIFLLGSNPKLVFEEKVESLKFLDVLNCVIAYIENLSLSSSLMSTEMTLAFVVPFLKKFNLCADDLNNYLPVSLLNF